MKTITSALAAGALALALLAPAMAQAAGTTILDEGFDDISALVGWSQFTNTPLASPAWTQGNPGVFSAQSGAADAYLGAAISGADSLFDLWLITPVLSFTGMTELSLSLRSLDNVAFNYRDYMEIRFDDGSGLNTFLGGTGSFATAPNRWTPITRTFDLEGSGRLAIRYVGETRGISYAGIDSIKVVSLVPEPASYLMLVMGLTGVAALRRKRA